MLDRFRADKHYFLKAQGAAARPERAL